VSKLHFYTHAGIGDTGWLYQKLQGNLDFTVTISDYGPRRSHNYLKLLGCKEVDYSKQYTPEDIYKYCLPANTDLTKLDYNQAQVLSVNGWMEAGNRIEDFLPQYDTKYILNFDTTDKHKLECKEFLSKYNKGSSKYIAVYTSSAENNAHRDVSFYSPQQWVELIKGMRSTFGEDAIFIILGAFYDRSCTDHVVKELLKEGIRHIDTVGCHIGVTVELLKAADACIAYPSGIGITADFVGTPCIMGMFLKIRKMHNMWQDPKRIANKQSIHFCLTEKHKFPDLIKELNLD
jgi:hypothetical protein